MSQIYGQVTVSTTVTGPFSPYMTIEEIKTHTMVNLSAAGSNDCLIDMSLTSEENGIGITSSVKSDTYYPSTLNGMNGDLDNLFFVRYLQFSNDYSRSVYDNGLPPGTYQLCFRAWTYDGPALSGEPPSGCATFIIPERTVNITTSFSAPYDKPLSDITNQLMVTLNANAEVERCFLTLSISGDNGISVQSTENTPDYFSLNRFIPKVITGADLNNLFSETALTFSGITSQRAMTRGLPPGNYSLCFRLWYDVGEPATGEDPVGCTSFTLVPPNVTAITQVMPSVSPQLASIGEKTMLTLQSTSNVEVKLRMQLEGDNGIVITTRPDFTPSSLAELTANIPLVLTSGELYEYFDPNNLAFTGISALAVNSRGLPEGSYRVCFNVYDEEGNQISSSFPAGCSNYFTIAYPEPPQLVSPLCDDTIPDNGVQNIVFNWTPSPGAPAFTQYTLRIAEILSGNMAPGKALQSAPTPPFFETEVTGTSFFYGPAQPLLETGKHYAWEVIAHDEETGTKFKNNGHSEPCSFIYGKSGEGLFYNPDIIIATQNQVPDVKKKQPITGNLQQVPYATVSGRLNYKFYSLVPHIQSGGDQSTSQPADVSSVMAGKQQQGAEKKQIPSDSKEVINYKDIYGQNNASSLTYSETINQSNLQYSQTPGVFIPGLPPTDPAIYTDGYLNTYDSKPLGGIKISLKEMYLLEDATLGNTSYEAGNMIITNDDIPGFAKEAGNTFFPNLNKTLATTTTNADGSFSFTFVHTDETGIVTDNFEFTVLKPNQDQFSPPQSITLFKGRLHRVLRLVVESPYYCSPDVNIKVQPNSSVDIGTLVSYVQSYNLKVKVLSVNSIANQAAGQGKSMGGVNVTVLRRYDRDNEIPEDEGAAESNKNKTVQTSFGTYPVISKGVTNADGYTVFGRMVRPDKNTDRYYVWVQTNDNKGFFTYKSAYQINHDVPADKYLTNSDYTLKAYNSVVHLIPNNPRIIGRVQDAVYDQPIPGAGIVLRSKFKTEKEPSDNWIEQVADFVTDNINEPEFTIIYESRTSDADGYFEYNNLPIQENEANALIGPQRRLFVFKTGYNSYTNPASNDDLILKRGDQLDLLSSIKLQPKGIVYGQVTDEKGNPVKARIKTPNGIEVETQTKTVISGTIDNGTFQFHQSEEFAVYLPSGFNEVTVQPLKTNAYSTEVFQLNVKDNNDTYLPEPLKVHSLKHRMRIYVTGKSTNFLKAVPGSKVTILGTTLVTNQYGYIEYEFKNLDDNFGVKIVPPEDVLLYQKTVNLSNNSTKDYVTYLEILPEATRIQGKVTLGKNKSPVNEARVFVDNGANSIPNQTYTNAEGLYSLKVPLFPEKTGEIISIENAFQNYLDSKKVSLNKEKTQSSNSEFMELSVPAQINTQYNSVFIPDNSNYKLKVNAVKSSALVTTVGDYKLVGIPNTDSVNFNLKVYNNMNITEILGIPVEIMELKELSPTQIEVHGNFISLPSNDNFSFSNDPEILPFGWTKLMPDTRMDSLNIPYAKPVGGQVNTKMPELYTDLYHTFMCVGKPVSGNLVKVSSDNTGLGYIDGKVKLLKQSFSLDQGDIEGNFTDNLWLGNQGSTSQTIRMFRSKYAAAPEKKGYRLATADNKDLAFKLFGFDVTANHTTSVILDDHITLPLKMKLNLPLSGNPTIDLGELKMTHEKIFPLDGSSPLEIPLEKWKLKIDKWYFTSSSGGITAPKGIINAEILDIPVEDLLIQPGQLDIGQAVLDNFTLSKVVNLNIDNNTVNFNFGYDGSVGENKTGHYAMSLIGKYDAPAATFGGLPGMKPYDKFTLQSIKLLSNGEKMLGFGMTTNPVIFYDVFKFTPIGIAVYDNFFQLNGSVNLGIPKLSTGYTALMDISKPGTDIKLNLHPIPFYFEGKGHVQFIAGNNQTLNENGFIADGKVTDPELFSLNAKIYRKKGATTKIDVIPGQQLAIGSGNTTRLEDVLGNMHVNAANTDWGYFTFNGDLEGTPGITDAYKRLTFTAFGAVKADNQQLGVSNMDLPFGNIEITYDFKASRLHGSLNVKGKKFGGLGIESANFEMLVDSKGWYFTGGGDFGVPEPIGNIKAGMIIGSYAEFTPLMEDNLMQYAYNKHLPSTLVNGVNGFFFTGQKSIQVPIPSYNLELLVGSVSFGAKAGLDARLWMSFNDNMIFGAGVMAFAKAYFTASSMLCTDLSFCTVAEMGVDGWFDTGSGTFGINGCGSLNLNTHVSQCTGAKKFGVGICIDPCLNIDISESLKLNVSFNSGSGADYSLGWGSCSGNNVKRGNCK
ncbi:hypothetical protein [Saccharicrinis sp. FJH54]|uniref:hypothetical protein n=1 Tax=Saccharicrinis sp. FJH54 TaxID=3344665 RepID=UPI0035D42583